MRETIEAAVAKRASALKIAVLKRLWWRDDFKKQETTGFILESILKLNQQTDTAWTNIGLVAGRWINPRILDTTTLAVGDHAFVLSGPDADGLRFGDWGEVVGATPTGVTVKLHLACCIIAVTPTGDIVEYVISGSPCGGTKLLQFDADGKACDSNDDSDELHLGSWSDAALYPCVLPRGGRFKEGVADQGSVGSKDHNQSWIRDQ
jgi:hypothetical protein